MKSSNNDKHTQDRIDGKTLIAKSLTFDCTKDGLLAFFGRFGQVESCHIVTDRDTGDSKGFAFITFERASDAAVAASEGDGTDLNGRPLVIEIAKPHIYRGGADATGGIQDGGDDGVSISSYKLEKIDQFNHKLVLRQNLLPHDMRDKQDFDFVASDEEEDEGAEETFVKSLSRKEKKTLLKKLSHMVTDEGKGDLSCESHKRKKKRKRSKDTHTNDHHEDRPKKRREKKTKKRKQRSYS
uniref:RRM domain-containing protein n=1 Tax=Octactis speculum TaxID=3111310 RepID=A0A6U3US10_9STRA|mmetsp:Transcript_42741/g.58354  ORF Transcript_42741/g.58354 Transcript_42741/m.58354 type:complete len:240 (+) Transcript_42741:58-777(+)